LRMLSTLYRVTPACRKDRVTLLTQIPDTG
jgi:hypothetical protein